MNGLRSPSRTHCVGPLFSLFIGAGLALAGDSKNTPPQAASLGEALFVHNWARPDTWTRPETLGNGGDGLGPVFNEVSCIACHAMTGPGGAGGNEHNVDLVSVDFPRGSGSAQRASLVKRARRIHPLLRPDNTTVILHQFGFGVDDDPYAYDTWRTLFIDATSPAGTRLSPQTPQARIQGVTFRLSQRSTPALWGVGRIERLRRGPGERLRLSLVLEQIGSSTGVSGRIPRTADGRAAWFGWRGHVHHLPEFVMSACANELGLSVSQHPQPPSPVLEEHRRQGPTALDLTNAQVAYLTRYVASLPQPKQIYPDDPGELSDVYAGERMFESVGCGECHVRDLGPAKEIFSDLLLHDMGTSLSDPSTAFPERPTFRQERRGGYSGGSSPEPDSPGATPLIRTNLAQEWKTPPLWGVADSPPYLHDGRAETLDEAIRLHDGEARTAAEEYRYLSEADRGQILTFLGTLRAPSPLLTATSEMP